jgi:hypothetical protein
MIKDVMVSLDGSLPDEATSAAAAEIARRFESQVIGLFLTPCPCQVRPAGTSARLQRPS